MDDDGYGLRIILSHRMIGVGSSVVMLSVTKIRNTHLIVIYVISTN
jgi:hypothetical protein